MVLFVIIKRLFMNNFSMDRHLGAKSIFCLAKIYSKIPKQMVRNNTNFLVILKQDYTNLQRDFNDHCFADMNFSKFHKMYHFC